ncbi:MAG TPA: hypothetical protein VE110_05435 [Gemmatimonadaceae bacterium]|nr:hypothetical protein [Gemmatimonadaceae bacterium]
MRLLLGGVLLPFLAPLARVPHQSTALPPATPILRYLTVGSHRIEFDVPGPGRAQFSSVARILGGKGNAEDTSVPALVRCYTLKGPAPHMILAFYGDETADSALTDFDLAPASRKPGLAGKCSPLAVTPRQVVTDRGIRIGLPRADVEEVLGQSRRAIDGQPIYEVTGPRTTRAGATTRTEDISSSITITYRRQIVVAFSGGISEAP